MLTFVIYDISENKSRSSLIKQLQHFGLHRIQKSVFVGDLSLNERFDLAEDIDFHLSSQKDSILIIPVCENCKDSIETFSELEIVLSYKLVDYKLL